MRSRAIGFSVVGFLAMLLVIFVALPRAEAQSTTDGAIGGTVADQSGAVVPNAVVRSRNLGTDSTSSGVTDGGGRYLLIHLQPGLYSLEISGTGFGAFRAVNITVEVGRVTTIDATLSVKALAETVVATAELPVITADRADFTTNINDTTIENLPINGRRWSTFALSTPGAVPDGGFGLVSFRGISGLLNNNTVDGADNNQAFFSEERGRTRISYSTSEAAIQEFQINTSNYSAEYGRSAGGVVNAVTKSGTNQLHGQAFWYDRDSDFGAINPFSFKSQLVNGVAARLPFLPPDKRHQFGGGIGGPIATARFSGDRRLGYSWRNRRPSDRGGTRHVGGTRSVSSAGECWPGVPAKSHWRSAQNGRPAYSSSQDRLECYFQTPRLCQLQPASLGFAGRNSNRRRCQSRHRKLRQ